MKTDALIGLLAQGAGPAPRAVAARRLAPVALAGGLISAALALAVLGLVPMAMFDTMVPWMKFSYAGLLALAAAWLTARLSRPVARLASPTRAVLAVVAAMLLFAGLMWQLSPAETRLPGFMGHSWRSCPFNVLALSLPALAGALWAVRGLAPTRLRAAGFAAGLLAGAVGAFGYAFACVETSPAFVAVWYTLGIGLTGGLGALLGPRVLRW
jgi:hypothetical protein